MPGAPRFPTYEVREVRLGASLELGSFATVDIPAGAHIWSVTGPILSRDEIVERVRAGIERSSDAPLQVDTDRFMDQEEPAVCFAHACDPNASLRGERELVALRPIRAGEAITYDDSLTIPASNPWVMAFVCACGSAACRRSVRGAASDRGRVVHFAVRWGSDSLSACSPDKCIADRSRPRAAITRLQSG